MSGAEAGGLWLVALALGGFALGGVPFGLFVSRAFGLADPRTIGSRNIGATNVLRSGSKPAALLTLILDMLKGVAPAVLGGLLLGAPGAAAGGLGAFLGHCYSPYLGFNGGKGVATGFGAILGWSPLIALAAALAWIAAALLSKRSSVGALTAAAAAVVGFVLEGSRALIAAVLVMAAVLVWRHRANIGRLLRGEEPKMSFGSSGGGSGR